MTPEMGGPLAHPEGSAEGHRNAQHAFEHDAAGALCGWPVQASVLQ